MMVKRKKTAKKLQKPKSFPAQLIKIDCIMIRVKDLKKSTPFYKDTLGLKQVWHDKQSKMIGFVFPKSDSEVVIHCDPSIPNPSFSFLVKDVIQCCDQFKEMGLKVLREPIGVRCGKFAVLADPDGNEIPIIDLTKFGDKPRYD